MESAGTFVASGVGSSAIFNLVKRAFAKLDEFGKKSDDVKVAKKKLDQAMVPVQSVLTAVDQGQIKVPGKALDDWVWQFRTAVEEAEDAIDEIDYYKLEEKVQARDKTAASGGGTVPVKKTLIRFVKHLPGTTDSTLKRLKEALKGLEKVSASVEPFLELVNSLNISSRGKSQDQSSRFRETGSLLTERVVIGREKEANAIIQWLENPGENIAQNISAFSVVGMGGMGKTTLARLICQEIQEKKILPFNTVAWVTVSDNFGALDAKVILTKILEDITKSSCGIQNLSTLQRMLKEQVLTKKFLLVLDDVWRDDPSSCDQWAQILAPLKFGKKGSKIVFTTRTESVADMITKLLEGSKECDHMKLTGLDDASTLELLDRYAFADVPDPDEHPNLRCISEDIARKLGGCPLAAKVMGLLLNEHVDYEYWERIWKQDISNLPSGEKGIMAVLRLSYHHLPAELQLCFRYCSIFPHQHKFIKDDLVKMWMGSGLIQWSKQSQRPEDIGAQFFDHLIRKSFFDVSRDSDHCFVMHDLIHEMVTSISSRECLRFEGVISKEKVPGTTRHLFIQIESLSAVKEISHLKHLHSLYIAFHGEQPEPKDILELNEILKELKSLRLLSITGGNLFELPNHVGDLIHLRYISLSQMAKKSLKWSPIPITKLYHLEVLIIFAFAIQELSNKDLTAMGNFVSLRHMNVHYSVSYKIPQIGKLISLQKLEDFNIWEEDGYKVSELKELKDVQELNIKHLNKVKSSSEAEEAKMNEKQSLKSLSLYWSEECSNSELILDTLKPHPHLQKLDITGYYGSRSPNWLENGHLSNLVSLRLYTCHNWESLPPLGKLISLRSLWLTNFPEVKHLGPSFYGSSDGSSFPSLRELRICTMPQWREWVDLKETTPFPRLEILELEGCSKLRTLPTMPFSLKLLSVRFSGLYTLPSICSTETGSPSDKPAFSILKISDCPDIVTLESGPLLQQEPFQALEEITIESCQKLEALPPKGFSGLISLKKLMIRGCPNLVTTEIRGDILPTSLSELWIEECGLEVSVMCSLRDLTSLVRIELRGCSNIRSLPSEEVFVKLKSLQHLSILDCAQISSLGGLGALLEISFLRITRCDELITISSSQPTTEISSYQGRVAGTALRIGELYISHSSLLQIEPLRSLCFTKKIMISWESQLEFWPDQWMLQNSAVLEEIEVDNAGALKFVPPSIVRLKSLMKLTLSRASLIDSLPELPISLRVLVITSCNEVFNKKYKKDSGSNWQEIEDIPQVVIF
ncbi:Disease resistance protein RGA2 [Rhynchospora pubera]|uniref:Disease resistance protein RGA2 n=1 Tax=Rhynchospora pubera TaxID=906938 RepID=A0AAV8DAH3_9POAL|nr:Disease resistance protein RGA2 [Rhynchospora pubera]